MTSETQETEDAAYRRGVGVMLLNRSGLVFIAERIDLPGAWQMPQGGIDGNELPARAALRELKEEIDAAEIIAESRRWLSYELPDSARGRVWGGRYRGQRQKWFLCRFTASDAAIDLDYHHHPEFQRWRWLEPALLPSVAAPFKRALYEAVLDEFRAHLGHQAAK